MKVICEKNQLEKITLPLSRVISARSTLPILENILFKAKGERLTLSATDLELGMEAEVEAKVLEEGAATIPARVFSEVVSHLGPFPVELSLNSNSNMVELRGEGFQYAFNFLPADEFPLLPQIQGAKEIKIQQSILKSMIKDTLFAASPPREDNLILTGVLMRIEKGVLTLVALDGYRLAKRSAPVGKGAQLDKSIIVPAKAFLELSKVLKETEDPVEISVTDNQILFKVAEFSFFSRLLDGQFPEYDKVIPKSGDVKIQVERESLLQALKRAVILAQERESPRLVKLTVEEGKLVITANTQDLGQAYEEVKILTQKGKGITIAFNAKFMMDPLTVMEEKEVVIELSLPTNPGVLKPADGKDSLYVLMPVRTGA